ncbi:MAG TPA: DCC1-like thiol-disulfide oxidoreductase family protein [Gemmatimonadaceae bacterium]|nr:DCC1-like thiol-disulfide oxidoreductase family protein [Gemmatimonadaceae bacterium]
MRRVTAALRRHWFAPASLRDLAIVRITLVAAQLLFFLPALQQQIALTRHDERLYVPIPALKVLMLPVAAWGARPTPDLLQAVWLLAVVSGVMALIGLYTRPSLLAFAAGNTLLTAHEYSYGESHHPEGLMMIALWLLALSPAGRASSVDELRARLDATRRTLTFRPARPEDDLDEMARWPLRTVQWLLVLAYLSAGLSKLVVGGMAWFSPATLQYYLIRDSLRWNAPLGVELAGHPVLVALAAVGTVAFELTFAVAVLVPRVTPFYLVGGALLHTGIFVAQHAPFFQFIALYVVFIRPRWRRIRSRAAPRPLTVVYDGACPLCLRTMTALDFLDGGGRLRYVDFERDWETAVGVVPGLTPPAAREAIHVVTPDGAVHRGFDAFHALARALPTLRPAGALMSLPPVSRIGRAVYARVAARRARVACTTESCRI